MRNILLILLIFSFFHSSKSHGARKINFKTLPLEHLMIIVYGENTANAVKAINEMGKRKDKKSMDALLQQLLLGHPPKLNYALIGALHKRKDARAFSTLMFFTKHRSAKIRILALKALCNLNVPKGSQNPKKINAVLLKSLRDFSINVRTQAAWFIGKRKVFQAENDLLKLFKKGSVAAIQALGYIGGIKTAQTLAIALESKMTKKTDIINTIGILLVKREDFGPEPVRIQLVKILGEIDLPSAQDVLLNYFSIGPNKFKKSRKLANKIISSK
jgi:HEAT repeat protein